MIEDIKVLDMVAVGTDDAQLLKDHVDAFQPNVLLISVPYGTYGMLQNCKPMIADVLDAGGLVLVGGALPTYLRERILHEVDSRLIVVVGEGEETAARLVQCWQLEKSTEGIANSVRAAPDGSVVVEPRSLSDPVAVPLPYREHLKDIKESGAQIFVESSRACSWAACSFCLRGLTDIEGRSREYRRLPVARLISDIDRLQADGVENFTFADEDFLGGTPAGVEEFVDSWRHAMTRRRSYSMRFDISATIRSIYDSRDDETRAAAKTRILQSLRNMGLNKIFLGIESGSPSQLRRYHKGHTSHEASEASKRVLRSGLALELGFIMFDPLCSLTEIVENVDFLLDSDLARYVSGPTSELRLQTESRYLEELRQKEGKIGRSLVVGDFDPDTLAYEYQYLDPYVGELVARVRVANERFHTFTYGVKGLTRFASGAILGEQADAAKALLGSYRTDSLHVLRQAALEDVASYTRLTAQLTKRFAHAFTALMRPERNKLHPMVMATVRSANEIAASP